MDFQKVNALLTYLTYFFGVIFSRFQNAFLLETKFTRVLNLKSTDERRSIFDCMHILYFKAELVNLYGIGIKNLLFKKEVGKPAFTLLCQTSRASANT